MSAANSPHTAINSTTAASQPPRHPLASASHRQESVATTTGTMDDDCERGSDECCDDDSTVWARLPSTNHLIRGQRDTYAVGRRIAPGRYGAVYEVLRKRDGKKFAAKLEVEEVHTNALSMDYLVLKAANDARKKREVASVGKDKETATSTGPTITSQICELTDRGRIAGHFKFLVMKILGENLYKLRLQFEEHRFSAPTALRLALEMLAALEELHSLGYVHRDVKPSNFAISEEPQTSAAVEKNQGSKNPTQQIQTQPLSNSNTTMTSVYLLDFGLCRQFRTSGGEVKPPRQNTQFRGTARYASLAAHRAEELYPKDDVESWFYVVIEFMSGELPWGTLHRDKNEEVRAAKEHARTTDGAIALLKHCPRAEFYRLMKYLDGLTYTDKVDYEAIREFIRTAMRNNDLNPDEPYDWQQPPQQQPSDQLNNQMLVINVGGPNEADEAEKVDGGGVKEANSKLTNLYPPNGTIMK